MLWLKSWLHSLIIGQSRLPPWFWMPGTHMKSISSSIWNCNIRKPRDVRQNQENYLKLSGQPAWFSANNSLHHRMWKEKLNPRAYVLTSERVYHGISVPYSQIYMHKHINIHIYVGFKHTHSHQIWLTCNSRVVCGYTIYKKPTMISVWFYKYWSSFSFICCRLYRMNI